MLEQLELLSDHLHHSSTAVRYMASRALAVLSVHRTSQVITFFIEHVLPKLGAMHNLRMRQGAIEALASILAAFVSVSVGWEKLGEGGGIFWAGQHSCCQFCVG